ncbi:hypothetical protein UNDKW_4024 [Undibacterium sp. KW1]|uniref:DUF4398 domain-containing protein n=1 Tax=Undibacterium sp. KW1 TaxID=2058624 RepID=UPI001331C762|nr:DUF4398 domain-containing protein [Undibacterium sp. KW1]BBB62279.1 hypothetical protein UNDKW_4006 [Undibacterium sp. KW1]BBB62297.1 hypothetical protein UNDKW_4024 [Undibacterium sp. KW1]
MSELTNDEIKSYMNKWDLDDKMLTPVRHAFNKADIHDRIREIMCVDSGQFKWPEHVDKIQTERRRKEILEDINTRIATISTLPQDMHCIANSKQIVRPSSEECWEAFVGAPLGGLLFNWLLLQGISFIFSVDLPTWLWRLTGTGFVILLFLVTTKQPQDRKKLATDIAERITKTIDEHKARLFHLQSELEDEHNIHLIRTRDLGGEHERSAVQTAQAVGAVTKNVAAETAKITKDLIKAGQKLQAENVATQTQTIDHLADRLEQQAHRPLPIAPPVQDERDARIAALQANVAKLEEIKALEARLAILKETT